ncbi:pinensin family lanthipeptide [Luteibaculum oceani]|uniref:Uncharacterized protein n=1 Tax=Luteibaculum oceani TaxID=1294296 RepID=A0A5C6UTY4_9FLAO|nr:pinensin family lanthipeptide [Luteibaculum oceani]TXC76050.1 hypothetical protein FRX97_11085 [Luteibaculum oceani]
MKKKLSIKDLEVKSFVTSLNDAQSHQHQGLGTNPLRCNSNIVQCGSQVDACVTAQICYPSRATCLTNNVSMLLYDCPL